MAFQRKRAAIAAEKALENSTGSARTEGMQAVAKSGGSGRITRILVRSAEEEVLPDLKKTDPDKVKADRESNQNKYREMKSVPLEHRLAARRSHIHGWGLFTKVDLPKNSMIVEYMGETVRQCIADKRERGYETSGIGSCYMFRLDVQHIVDATTIGCMARFMNHCCRPNAYAKVINVDTELGPEKKIVVFANREIAAGDEITYDYKFPVEDGSLRCTCGAPNCIGRMN
jgi:histone-lysine N-methyltransferase SETD1